MKTVHPVFCILAVCAALFVTALTGEAHPYASGVTNDNGTIKFILNESGGDVNVVFEDNTTNAMGVLNKGLQSFPLNGHTSYAIYVRKIGNGNPSLITSDSDQFSIWNSPRGVDVNKNPKLGHLFGRTYVGNSAVGGTAPNNKGKGLYALNADLTDSPLGFGANATASSLWQDSGANGPWRLRIASDNSVYVSDFATDKTLWQLTPDLSASTAVMTGTMDYFGTPIVTGSIATGDLVVWTTDGGIPAPASAVLGPNTSVGSYNCLFRYDIGSGPLPWTGDPNYAYTVGLDSIAGLRVEGDIGVDGKIIGGFGRANYSNGNIQILDPTGTTVLYNSLQGGIDLFNGTANGGAAVGTYAGVRVSPDGRFLASVSAVNRITIAVLTNGIPDESSIFSIPNTPAVGNSRGMCWDAANNLYVCSSGQGLLRGYSLGLSTTAVTRNDSTGTNGTFELILPAINASVLATTPLASQNYINNANPGTPIPGVFTVSLATNFLEAPVTVTFNLSGTAVLNSNFTINTGTNGNGVVITTNSVTFPVGAAPGGGNWEQGINITPTAIPVIGPTLTTTLRLNGGANYVATVPVIASVSIANTGPQSLVLSASPNGTTMNRGIAGDYAKFIITRLGDTNGPGNSPGNVVATSYTVNKFTYGGTAAPFPADYTAAAQNLPVSGIPIDGAPGIVISPGQVVFTGIIGNPVIHPNLNVPPTNVTITISLTNSVNGTNLLSQEGNAYTVGTGAVTLTELDNTVGPEVVVWSNPLTNAADSVNWTLTFASTNLGVTTVPPVVIPNYDQNALPNSINGGGSNNFNVVFGSSVASDFVPPSPVMTANGWDTALRMTVNKDFTFGAPAGVNVYPQGQVFKGNYALRFNMYLSFYSGNIDNPVANTFGNEFALFGINHNGTNCNWKPTTPVTAASGGSGMTNSDGIWMAVNAGAGSVSPADYDGFAPFPLPNSGIPGSGVANGEPVSATAASQAGVFKRPPFVGADTAAHRNGGTPINKWVDVSVEVTKQTNISLFIARSPVLTAFAGTNGFTDGPFMLGYLDPVKDVSDPGSAFVYYSNVRVVELSPYITNQPVSLIVTQGANVSFTSSATYGTAPITNQWSSGTTGPVTLLETDTADDTSITSSLDLTNVTTNQATNYYAVFSDIAGAVTGSVATLEVVVPPVNVVASTGTNVTFRVTAVGPTPPTSYQWKFNGADLANNTHYSGVTTDVLTITNVQAADVGTYSVTVVNASGSVSPSAELIVASSPTFTSVSLTATDVVLTFSSPNGSDTVDSFQLQSSAVVTGPYTNTPASFITSGEGFQITVPQNGGNMFYRLLRN